MKTTIKIIDNNLYEYDEKGKCIHFKDSNGYEVWYNSNGIKITKEEFEANKHNKQSCAGKVITIDGKQYKLIPV